MITKGEINKWVGHKDFGRIACIDFDGCICEFDGWQGPNVFGKPVIGASSHMALLKAYGWTIYIYSSRLVTLELVTWLADHHIVYDNINGRKTPHGTYLLQSYNVSDEEYPTEYPQYCEWDHNPRLCSTKPIASVYIDDMNVENEGKNYDFEKWQSVTSRLLERFGRSSDTPDVMH